MTAQDSPCSPGRAAVFIPLEAEGKVLVVRAILAGAAEARLVVDSGAGTSALSVACAQRLRLEVKTGLRVRTPTGLTAVGTIRLSSIRVGPFEVRNLAFASVPLPNDRVDGLLGLDFFRAIGASRLHLDLRQPGLEIVLARQPRRPPADG